MRIRYGITVVFGVCAALGSAPSRAGPGTDPGAMPMLLAQANGPAVPSGLATPPSAALPNALIQRFGIGRQPAAGVSPGAAGSDKSGIALAPDAAGNAPTTPPDAVPDLAEAPEGPATLAQASDTPAPPPQIAPPELVPPALAARPPVAAQPVPVAPPPSPAASDVPPPPPVTATAVPPPPPPPPSLRVYVLVGAEQRGPLDESGLADLVRAGDLRDGSYVWMSGMPAWQAASMVPPVASILADTPQPPPPLAYYIADAGRTTGPFDRAALEAMIAAGGLTPATLVYTTGMAGWAEASAQADLAAMFNISPQPSGAPADSGAGLVQTDDNSPREVGPTSTAAQPAAPSPQEPVSVNPQSPGPQSSEPQVTEPQSPAPQVAGPRSPEPLIAEPQLAQPKSGGSQVSGSTGTGRPVGPAVAAGPDDPVAPVQPAEPVMPGFDATAYVAGTWTLIGTQDIPGVGPAQLEIRVVYAADGSTTVDARGRSRVVNGFISYISDGTGSWEASAAGPAEGPAQITVTDTLSVRLLVRAPGKPTQTVTSDIEDTTVYEVVDDNTMRSTEDGIVLTRVAD